MKRLIETLNNATGSSLTSARLDKAFDLCYSDLEKSINGLKSGMDNSNETEESEKNSTVLDSNLFEELLETSRNTQRLIGNTDSKLYGNIDQVSKKVDELIDITEKRNAMDSRRFQRRWEYPMLREVMFKTREVFPYSILIVLSFVRDLLPWLYEAGSDLVKTLNSREKIESKKLAIRNFNRLIDLTLDSPLSRDIMVGRKDIYMILKDLQMIREESSSEFLNI